MNESIAALIAIAVLIVVVFIGIKYFNNFVPVRVAFIVIFVISLLAAIILGLRAWGPNGEASMFFSNENTLQDGKEDIDSVDSEHKKDDLIRDNADIYADLKADSDHYGENSLFLIVKKDEVSFNDQKFEDIEALEDFFRNINFSGKELYVVDVYGSASTMHGVLEVVERYIENYHMEQR